MTKKKVTTMWKQSEVVTARGKCKQRISCVTYHGPFGANRSRILWWNDNRPFKSTDLCAEEFRVVQHLLSCLRNTLRGPGGSTQPTGPFVDVVCGEFGFSMSKLSSFPRKFQGNDLVLSVSSLCEFLMRVDDIDGLST
jgi:hypothetical protein